MGSARDNYISWDEGALPSPPGEKWDFPLVMPKNPYKRALKRGLGQVVRMVKPEIVARVERTGQANSFVEELVLADLVARHREEGTLDRLAHFHTNFWAGRNALTFHSTHEHRFHNEFLKAHYVLVEELAKILNAENAPRILYEIGCGSGLVLDHLASRFPRLKELVGLDLCAEQITSNSERYSDPRITFVAADAAEWLRDNAEANSVVFTYGGVLEYFTQSNLEATLADLASKAPSCIAIAEPIALDFDFETQFQSQPYGSELSYSHNYPHLVSNAGFKIRWQADTGSRWMLLIATANARRSRVRRS